MEINKYLKFTNLYRALFISLALDLFLFLPSLIEPLSEDKVQIAELFFVITLILFLIFIYGVRFFVRSFEDSRSEYSKIANKQVVLVFLFIAILIFSTFVLALFFTLDFNIFITPLVIFIVTIVSLSKSFDSKKHQFAKEKMDYILNYMSLVELCGIFVLLISRVLSFVLILTAVLITREWYLVFIVYIFNLFTLSSLSGLYHQLRVDLFDFE